MNAVEQERFFKDLRAAHPKWTVRFCSGYVHGATDEGMRHAPNPSFIGQDPDDYALGYLVGFAVHRGPDAEVEPWFSGLGRLVEEAIGHETA